MALPIIFMMLFFCCHPPKKQGAGVEAKYIISALFKSSTVILKA